MTDRILRLPEVKALTGFSTSSIYYFIKCDEFPKQIRLSKRCVGWLESDIKDWIKNRIDAAEKVGGGNNV